MICGFCHIKMIEESEVKEDQTELFYWCCERCHQTKAPHLIKKSDRINDRSLSAKKTTIPPIGKYRNHPKYVNL